VRALRIIVAAILIAAISAGIGFAVNAIRPRGGLPLIRPQPAALFITVDEAKAALDSGEAIFVDARLPVDYDGGHIPGALNLPLDNVAQDYQRVLGGIDKTRLIITYCDGPPCPDGEELADLLTREYGRANVRPMGPEQGLDQWREAGYPVETKPGGPPPRPAQSTAVPVLIIVIAALLAILPMATRGGARSAFVVLARVLIGALLISAAYSKILDPNEFAKGAIAYQAVPDSWANLPAIVLPWMELITGLLLVIGAFTRGAALVASALFVAFTAMMWSALARGIVIENCHCFGFAEPLSPLLIVRDVALLAAALVPLFAGAGALAADALCRPAAGQSQPSRQPPAAPSGEPASPPVPAASGHAGAEQDPPEDDSPRTYPPHQGQKS
jgi:uncharacterized membrane protein YphA (DoxX/SURF4 family)/rhodanese-related sulfurtransferase